MKSKCQKGPDTQKRQTTHSGLEQNRRKNNPCQHCKDLNTPRQTAHVQQRDMLQVTAISSSTQRPTPKITSKCSQAELDSKALPQLSHRNAKGFGDYLQNLGCRKNQSWNFSLSDKVGSATGSEFSMGRTLRSPSGGSSWLCSAGTERAGCHLLGCFTSLI